MCMKYPKYAFRRRFFFFTTPMATNNYLHTNSFIILKIYYLWGVHFASISHSYFLEHVLNLYVGK